MSGGVFDGKLLDGEKIIWCGRPGQGVVFSSRDGILIPFSFMWGGFAVFWEQRSLSSPQSPLMMKVWGIPFVLIGLYLMFGRFFVDAYVRRRMHYAVTNRRILILRERPFATFITVHLDRLPDLKLTEGKHGRGTIYFGQQVEGFESRGSGTWTPALDATPKFFAINDVAKVFDTIQLAAQPARILS